MFTETITDWEKVPAPLLIHIPYVRFLTSVFRVRFIDQMHQEEHVIGQIVFLLYVCIESVRHFIEIILSYATNEAIRFHVLFNALQLITKLTERINNQTWKQTRE